MIEGGTTCSPGTAFSKLPCIRIEVPERIEVGKPIFLISQLPCCANLALPYWAKIVGNIVNNGSEEKLLRIEATILGPSNHRICGYEDYIALESGSTVEFDIKIYQYDERAEAYSLIVGEAREF